MDKLNTFIEQYSKNKNFKMKHINLNNELIEIANSRKGQLTFSEEERIKGIIDGKIDFDSYQDEYIKGFINPFIETLPEKAKEIIKQVKIKILPTFEINASAVKGPNGEYIIILHQQLMTALGHYNEAQMIGGLVMFSDPKVGEDFLINAYKEIIKCYKYKNYLPQFHQLPAVLTRDLYLQSMEKTIIQELFLVAHEFAHIYLGHLTETEENTFHFLGEEIKVEQYVKSQRQELEADILALEWIINAFKKEKLTLLSNVPNEQATYFAVEIFMFLHMIEVNSSSRYTNYSENASSSKRLTELEKMQRLLDVSLQLDQLKSGKMVGQKMKHPYASIRMLHVIAKIQPLLDENEKKNLMNMLEDMVYYETFLVEKL